MNLNNTCLEQCNPKQVINILVAINDISTISVKDKCGNIYNTSDLNYSYSTDNVCWSSYMSYDEILSTTFGIDYDFYLRIKVAGYVSDVTINGISITDYKTSIAEGFDFKATICSTSQPQNLFNPYINMDCAISLQQQLTETVACMLGIPIYYIKLSGNTNSKDLTFKEYTLLNVESIKQIKMIIMDNQMPSSKPEFTDWGIDFQSDWETEISKGMFATAFGQNAQPMEGDLVYIPMMKRMWMVNGAYEEKKDALMWNATTFKLFLVKYQEKGSVDLGNDEDFVESLVHNKYADIFGDDENVASNEETLIGETYIPDTLYPVYKSDSLRKKMSVDSIRYISENYYHNGTLIADSKYETSINNSKITYQRKYCGEDGVLSFIIEPSNIDNDCMLFYIGSFVVYLKQSEAVIKNGKIIKKQQTTITVGDNVASINIFGNNAHFVFIRWNRMMNFITISATPYAHKDIPEYMLHNQHYFFDMENTITTTSKYDINFVVTEKSEVALTLPIGKITNIKLFDSDIDNISEILQMYPNNQHLIINDTARKILSMDGITLN